ncbi:hypothetical protein [Bdellovibrio sp. NC01]|uniref:hypothetical protein n=1 Tax=Bdellovibrio sp. NC01 TaxID=2220073 RepID=UPI001FF050E4|nr:hypothetical protein [Bdellovibrio sp. NC01]
MRSLRLSLAVLATLSSMQMAKAQSQESAPQEPPYTQENEFENSTPSTPAQSDDVLSIEDEIRSANPQTPAAEPKQEQKSVNLNETVPEAGPEVPVEPSQEKPSEQITNEEPAVIPVAPVVEVHPSQEIKAGEVVRQSPKGGVEYIHHPQAAKGLLMIEKDGSYIYRTREDHKFSQTGTIRVGMMDAPKITSADGATNFETMYKGPPVPVVMFDYEWQPFTSFGRLGIQGGLGVIVAQGNGRFACDPAQCGTMNGTEAKEKYTFVAVPLNLGVIYRLEWADRQLFAPYISGGGTYIPVAEFRDDDKSPNAVGTPGVYGAGGLMINLSRIDRETAFTLKNEYGIANLWLTAEYRYLKTFNEELDFSSSIVTLGVGVDY